MGILALPLAGSLSGCFLFGYDELSLSDKHGDQPDKYGDEPEQDGASFSPLEDAGAPGSGPPRVDADGEVPSPVAPDAAAEDAFGDGYDGLLPGAGGSGLVSSTECSGPTSDCEPVCTGELRRCTVDCADATRCATECQPNTQCHVGCGGVNSCDLFCARGSRCALDCSHTNYDGASSCDVSCEAGARCAVDCHESNRCAVSCDAHSACAVDCRKSNSCRDVTCAAGAACLLYCPESDCSEAACLGDAKTCADGTIACGMDCPLPEAWDWDEFSLALGSHQL